MGTFWSTKGLRFVWSLNASTPHTETLPTLGLLSLFYVKTKHKDKTHHFCASNSGLRANSFAVLLEKGECSIIESRYCQLFILILFVSICVQQVLHLLDCVIVCTLFPEIERPRLSHIIHNKLWFCCAHFGAFTHTTHRDGKVGQQHNWQSFPTNTMGILRLVKITEIISIYHTMI